MHALASVRIVLLALWAALWLDVELAREAVHQPVIAGVMLLVWCSVKQGARAIGDRA